VGNFGDCKSLGNELFELRFSESIRGYFPKINDKVVILLSGVSKNNKGEQSRDIAKARDFLLGKRG
jgi:putative addiction module killer protein